MYKRNKILVVLKYLPFYRLALFNELSRIENPLYEFIGDKNGREGIKTIPLEYLNLPIEKGGINWSFSKSFYYYKSRQFFQSRVISKILSNDYKVFILDGNFKQLTTWIFTIICRLNGKKVIFWTHGLKGNDKFLKKKLRKYFFMKLPHRVMVYGNFSKEIMELEGFDSNKIFVVGNSLNYNGQKFIRNQVLSDNKTLSNLKRRIFSELAKTIIFIGRLLANKRIDEIINSIYDLKMKGLKLNCIIIGDGVEKNNLIKLSEKLNLSQNIYFTGPLYKEEEIARYFLISDLLVSPGNVGLNCIHSLSYGIPVLTHNNIQFHGPEFEAIANGENGILFQYGDFNDLTEKINEWFSTDHDDVLLKCILPVEKRFNSKTHAELINKAVLDV